MTANLSFKATVLFKGEYLKIVYFRGSYYRTLLGNYRQAIKMVPFSHDKKTMTLCDPD